MLWKQKLVVDLFLQAVIPITVQSPSTRQANSPHPSYTGSVLFQNTFNGQLPATDYPKLDVNGFVFLVENKINLFEQFYFMMFLFYTVFGLVWAWFCYRHLQELLPIQVRSFISFVVLI